MAIRAVISRPPGPSPRTSAVLRASPDPQGPAARTAPPPPRGLHRALFVFSTACACALAVTRPAAAETPASVPDPVAQALFQDGRDLVDKGDWEAGCTKFEASMLLYPAASTLLNIARCFEHRKKLAAAWSTYKRARVLNRETLGDERRRAIDELIDAQLAALSPRLPKIRLQLTRKVLGVTLRKDGEVLPSAVVGTEVPVDPGEHEIAAEAPGHLPFRARFDIAEGTSRDIAIDLVSEADAAAGEGGSSVPTWAWVTGGASLLFFGVSAAFRIDQAFIEGRQSALCQGDVQSGCPPRAEYDPASDNTRKNVDFGISLGFGVAGAAALAASLVGIVRGTTTGPLTRTAISIAPGGAAASATFQF